MSHLNSVVNKGEKGLLSLGYKIAKGEIYGEIKDAKFVLYVQ